MVTIVNFTFFFFNHTYKKENGGGGKRIGGINFSFT